MPVEGPRGSWFRNALERYDLYYAVPVVISVAAFIVAVLAYFR